MSTNKHHTNNEQKKKNREQRSSTFAAKIPNSQQLTWEGQAVRAGGIV